jgi:uncharacterized protein YlzI (FlbEa/FlbD family)
MMTDFVKLTGNSGVELWVNPALVETVGAHPMGTVLLIGTQVVTCTASPDRVVQQLQSRSRDEERDLVRRLLLVQDTLTHGQPTSAAETERLEAEEIEVIERLRQIVGMPLPSDLM